MSCSMLVLVLVPEIVSKRNNDTYHHGDTHAVPAW